MDKLLRKRKEIKSLLIDFELLKVLKEEKEFKVHSAFKNTINLISEQEHFFTIGKKGFLSPGYNILIVENFNELFSNLIHSHESIYFKDQKLLSKQLEINFKEIQLWTSKKRKEIKKESIRSSIKIIKHKMLSLEENHWMNYFIYEGKHLSNSFVYKKYNEFIEDRSKYKDLIGLGEGLTPAGDDFLTGILIAEFAMEETLILKDSNFLANIKKQTNMISFAMIQLVYHGKLKQDYMDLINSIGEDTFEQNIHKVLDFGATSGKHIMTGFVIGLELLYKKGGI